MGAEQIGNPIMWADAGGLAGLVILALFITLSIGLYSAKGIVTVFRNEICKLLETHAKERDRLSEIIDIRQRETNEAIRGMTIALNKMADRSRRYDKDEGE